MTIWPQSPPEILKIRDFYLSNTVEAVLWYTVCGCQWNLYTRIENVMADRSSRLTSDVYKSILVY